MPQGNQQSKIRNRRTRFGNLAGVLLRNSDRPPNQRIAIAVSFGRNQQTQLGIGTHRGRVTRFDQGRERLVRGLRIRMLKSGILRGPPPPSPGHPRSHLVQRDRSSRSQPEMP